MSKNQKKNPFFQKSEIKKKKTKKNAEKKLFSYFCQLRRIVFDQRRMEEDGGGAGNPCV